MEFKLVLTPDRPTNGELVLEAEIPMSGVRFMCEVSKCLRRSIDHVGRCRHNTLGALVTYEINVPQQMAIDSGLFEDTDTVTVIVEHNLLSYFVFYGANIATGASGRPCYPYTQNEATLTSMIDELTFLDAWANTGYALRLMMSGNQLVSCNYIPVPGGNNGGVGCDGCTCGKDDHKEPHPPHGDLTPPDKHPWPPAYHKPHHHPKPPKPPVIGNPSGDWSSGAAKPGDIRLQPIETASSYRGGTAY